MFYVGYLWILAAPKESISPQNIRCRNTLLFFCTHGGWGVGGGRMRKRGRKKVGGRERKRKNMNIYMLTRLFSLVTSKTCLDVQNQFFTLQGKTSSSKCFIIPWDKKEKTRSQLLIFYRINNKGSMKHSDKFSCWSSLFEDCSLVRQCPARCSAAWRCSERQRKSN